MTERHPPADDDMELSVIGWAATSPDARELFFEELRRRDFWCPPRRALFTETRRLWRSGLLDHGFEVRGTDVVHVWRGLAETWRVELEAIVESGDVAIYFPQRGRAAVERLRMLTKQRAILAAAERVLTGELLSESLLEYLLADEGASA
jgi:hypothetical protein